MFPVHDFDDRTVAFPADIESVMPLWSDIPNTFKQTGSNPWVQLTADWFYHGIDIDMKPVDGVEGKKAIRHCVAIMRSYQPKHEHKMAAVAYLLSQWFQGPPKWKRSAR